jgi:hypothetical protein
MWQRPCLAKQRQTCANCGTEKEREAFPVIATSGRWGTPYERVGTVCLQCKDDPLHRCARCGHMARRSTFEHCAYTRPNGQAIVRYSRLCATCLLPERARCPQCGEEKDRALFGTRTNYSADGQPRTRVQMPCKACRLPAIAEDRRHPVVHRVLRARRRQVYAARRAEIATAKRQRRRAKYGQYRAAERARKQRTRRSAQDVLTQRYCAAVCALYETTFDALCTARRDDAAVEPRAVLAYLLATDVRLRVTEIARLLGQHHTTVSYHVDRLRRCRSYEERAVIQMLKEAAGRYWHGAHHRSPLRKAG